MVVKSMDREVAKVLRARLEETLAKLGEEFGMNVGIVGRGSISDTSLDYKISMAVIEHSESGEALSQGMTALHSQIEMNSGRVEGLSLDDLDVEFVMRSQTFKIHGFLPNSPARCFEIRDVKTNKVYITRLENVVNAIGRARLDKAA